MEEFIKNFADQFDETDTSNFTAETKFQLLAEWESLIAMSVLNMIAKKYGVKLEPRELRESLTIGEVYSLVQFKLSVKK